MAKAIEDRRRALGMTVGALARAADVTPQGLLPVRRGEIRDYQDRLTLGVCRALGWTPDSIERLMRGDGALELHAGPEVTDTEALQDQVTQLASLVRELASRVARLESRS